MEFGSPNTSTGSDEERFDKNRYINQRIACIGVRYEGMQTTKYGDQEVANVEKVVVLEGPDKGKEYKDVRFFGVFASCLNGSPDNVAGIVAKGDAAPGQNAPWLFLDDIEATTLARQWAEKAESF